MPQVKVDDHVLVVERTRWLSLRQGLIRQSPAYSSQILSYSWASRDLASGISGPRHAELDSGQQIRPSTPKHGNAHLSRCTERGSRLCLLEHGYGPVGDD